MAALEVLFGNFQLKVATGECWESVAGWPCSEKFPEEVGYKWFGRRLSPISSSRNSWWVGGCVRGAFR